ncbi:MAG TPA: secretin N-terminal domain-containing protein, partial [Burkholderiales bacterium]|nr:secretin N-terminal domain-containing protein [Burkholderiales bacterium]
IEAGNEEQGLARLEEAMKANPNDAEIRSYYLRHRTVAVQRYLQTGDNARTAGQLDAAQAAYVRAQRFEPENANAKAGLEAVARDRASLSLVREAEDAFKRGDLDAALAKAREVLESNPSQREARAMVRKVEERKVKAEATSPQLGAALKSTITIELRDAPVRTVLELISKKSGLNFVYDRDVPPELRVTVFVRDTTIEEVIRFVLVTSQLERRVLNPNTVLIYPNTPQKAQAYRELTVKSFYLANADAKQTANMVRSLAKTRDLYVDEKLNLLVVRDTPEAIRMVEKLIASHDLVEPEVMLEVEVLEIGHNTMTQLGIEWPGRAALGVTGAAGTPGQLTGTEAKNLNSGLFRLTVSDPLLALNLRQQAGRTNVLANPRIRVKNKEKARIHIGDKVPVITTTAGATGFVSESVNYLDVGLKLEVEPLVSLEDMVGIKVALEVSNISNEVKTTGGTVAYQVGTRNTSTTLQLRDGETQVLAGLINDEDRRSATKVPGASRLPLIGRLFSSSNDTVNKTEIVLLITPRVLRNLERPGPRVEEFNSGTELEVGRAGGGPLPPISQPAPAPVTPAPVTPAPVTPAPAAPRPPAAGPAPVKP